jgi:hypothetical protein
VTFAGLDPLRPTVLKTGAASAAAAAVGSIASAILLLIKRLKQARQRTTALCVLNGGFGEGPAAGEGRSRAYSVRYRGEILAGAAVRRAVARQSHAAPSPFVSY